MPAAGGSKKKKTPVKATSRATKATPRATKASPRTGAAKASPRAAATPAKKKAEPASTKRVVEGTISSFDDSSGTGYVSVGEDWLPVDLSTVDYENDHFVQWRPGRKVRATIGDSGVESIRVDDEYTQSQS